MNDLKVKIGGDTSGWELATAKVRGEARRMVADLGSSVGNRIAGFFAAGSLAYTIHKTAEYAGQLTDLSARTGVSVEALQRLDKAAQENGTSLDALVGLWERVGSAREDALRKPTGDAAKAFGALGVSQGDLQSKSPDEIVRKIADAFQNSANVEQLIAPLRDIGGRGAGQMIALFRAGLDQQYQDMQVMTGEQADLLDELDDKWSTLGKTISIFVAPWLIKLIEGLQWFGNQCQQVVGGIRSAWDWLVGNQGKGGNDVVADAKGLWAAFQKGVVSTEADQKDAADRAAVARTERVKSRLQFGQTDYSNITPDAVKQAAFKIGEMQLDDLSKAGLFAGGAGMGMMNNFPERQLAATEKIVSELQQVKGVLEESL